MTDKPIVTIRMPIPNEASFEDIRAVFASVPKRYRDQARLCVPYDESSPVVQWSRPETEKEHIAREKESARQAQLQELRERATLRSLAEKHGLKISIPEDETAVDDLSDQVDDQTWFERRECQLFGMPLAALRDLESKGTA